MPATLIAATAARVAARPRASLRRGGARHASSKPVGRHSVVSASLDKDRQDQQGDKESRLRRLLKVKLSGKESESLVATLRELQLDTPAKLRNFLLKSSSVRALLLLSDVGINTIGAVCAYASFRLLVDSAGSAAAIEATIKYVMAAVAAFGTGWFTSSIAADVVVLITTLVAATRFGLSADSFLALLPAVDDGAPRLPRSNPVDSAQAAHAALTSAGKLEKAMTALQALQAPSKSKGDLASSLSAYLTLASAEERGFKPDALALSAADMQAVSRAFATCDKDGDGELSVSELRVLLAEMTGEPCSQEDAETCMRALDTVGNSRLNLEAFARWWAEVKPPPAEQQQQQQQ